MQTPQQLLSAFGLAAALVCAPLVQASEPVWDGNKVEMVKQELAPNVYAFYAKDAKELNAKGGAAATSSGLIVGTRASLVIDTMLNQRLHQQIRKLMPGKDMPSYAVNTSAHGDHSYGNMYLPKTTRVIQHAHTQDFIGKHLETDKAFMIKHFGTGRGIEEIKARPADILVPKDGKISLDLGGRQVDIIDFGFGQTGGDLFVWEPQSKVLWAGNVILAGKPALPWLLDGHLLETLATLQKVYAFLPADARIIPGHGVEIKKADILWSIDYLTAVRDGVQQGIAQGLSQEQIVKQVSLPQFRGYALFDWVHPGLNVPAAYKDLSAAKAAGK